jgi:hypothetical protein
MSTGYGSILAGKVMYFSDSPEKYHSCRSFRYKQLLSQEVNALQPPQSTLNKDYHGYQAVLDAYVLTLKLPMFSMSICCSFIHSWSNTRLERKDKR